MPPSLVALYILWMCGEIFVVRSEKNCTIRGGVGRSVVVREVENGEVVACVLVYVCTPINYIN